MKKGTGSELTAVSAAENAFLEVPVLFFTRRRAFVVLFCVAAAVALWAAHVTILRAMALWLDVGQRPHHAEYVMVLGGGEETRPFAAAALVRAHFADRALMARAAPLPPDLTRIVSNSSTIMRRVLLARGVKESNITVLPGEAKTTHDEAAALAAFLDEHPAARVLVVTDGYHTRRSRWVFDRVLGDRAGQVAFVSSPSDEFDLNCWWQDQWGLAAIGAEYLKFPAYLVCYGHFLPWLAACLLLATAVHFAANRLRRQSCAAS